MTKHCEVCGESYEDASRNQVRRTCSSACRYKLSMADPGHRIAELLRMRKNVLVANGADVNDSDWGRVAAEVEAGICAICGRRQDIRRIHIDHNHATGRLRNALCAACNKALGWYEQLPAEAQARLPQYLAGWA